MKWLAFLLLFSCASKKQAFVEHFTGQVFIFKPKQAKPIGKYPILVRRTVDPVAGQIMEELIQPDFKTHKLKELTTFLRMRSVVGVFDASDAAQNFSGVVKYQGTPWGWEEWTYALNIKNGPQIRGWGQFEGKFMLTLKQIYDRKGHLNYILKEILQEIDAVEFKRQKKLVLSALTKSKK